MAPYTFKLGGEKLCRDHLMCKESQDKMIDMKEGILVNTYTRKTASPKQSPNIYVMINVDFEISGQLISQFTFLGYMPN